MSSFKFPLISLAQIRDGEDGDFVYDAINRPISTNFIVTGPPGSGKSTIAAHRLERYSSKDILYVTYGNLLANYVRSSVSDECKGIVIAFHKWITTQDYGQEGIKRAFDEFLEKRSGKKLDMLIIDEGQDLGPEIYNQCGKIADSIVVFCDNGQILYRQHCTKSTDIAKLIRGDQVTLEFNRRNPKKLFQFALQFDPKDVDSGDVRLMKNSANPVEAIYYPDENSELNGILDLLENYLLKNVGILFYNQSEVDAFKERLINSGKVDGRDFCYYHNGNQCGMSNGFKSPVLTTFKSAKGLTFDIVLMPNQKIRRPVGLDISNDVFVACTRAQDKLFFTNCRNSPGYFSKILDSFDQDTYKRVEISDGNLGTGKASVKSSIEIIDIPF